MSVATQFAPTVPVPARARTARERLLAAPDGHPAEVPTVRPPAVVPGASISRLRPPRSRDAVAPIRLTRRGVLVLSLAVTVLGGVLVWLAALSAPGAAAPVRPVPSVVTVAPGDTLWSIAGRVAPDTDPRAEVATLQRLNHLDNVDLVPGQRLRVR